MGVPAFLRKWLDAHLAQRVGVQPVRFEGWKDLYQDVGRRTRMYLNGPQASEILGVVSLLDLYGPDIYPAAASTADERYTWAREHIEHKVGDCRFRQFFAVHETEAWLLSQPANFHPDVRQSLSCEGWPARQPGDNGVPHATDPVDNCHVTHYRVVW